MSNQELKELIQQNIAENAPNNNVIAALCIIMDQIRQNMTLPAQVQSDYTQTDPTAVDFIKNKPIHYEAFLDTQGSRLLPDCVAQLEIIELLSQNAPERFIGGYMKDSTTNTLYSILEASSSNLSIYRGALISEYDETILEGLAAIQLAANIRNKFPDLRWPSTYLYVNNFTSLPTCYVCVGGKLLVCAGENKGTLTGLTVSNNEPAPGANFINISEEAAMKLIGYEWSPA